MLDDHISLAVEPYWKRRREVGGAFRDIDFILFDRLLSQQSASGTTGDALEIGVLRGKSAIVIGSHLRDDENLYACDVFEDPGVDRANTLENRDSYQGLTKAEFLRNYARFVQREPKVIHGYSTLVPDHIAPTSLRFAHIDGSHLHDVVEQDLRDVEPLMNTEGVLVMDDYRAVHTPGVAAAVWSAVHNDGLVPFCLSEYKFYGTWNRELAREYVRDLRAWVAGYPEVNHGVQTLAGEEVLIIGTPPSRTPRTLVKGLVPPLLFDKLRPTAPPHLGA